MLEVKHLRRLATIAAGLAILGAGWIVGAKGPAIAWAHNVPISQTFTSYSYDGSNCVSAKDPVGVVFYNASSRQQVEAHLVANDHTNWNSDGNVGWWKHDFFVHDNGCNSNVSARALHNFYSSGDHIRLQDKMTSDGGLAVVGTPHYDQRTWIWIPPHYTHCVPTWGYTSAQNNVYGAFISNGNHPYWSSSYWGNDALIPQCGSWAWGNGYVYYINMYGN